MEKIILYNFYSFLEKISSSFPIGLICFLLSAITGLLFIISFIVGLIPSIISGERKWFLLFLIFSHSVSLLFAVCDAFYVSEYFLSIFQASVYVLISFIVSLALYCVLRMQTALKQRNAEKKLSKIISMEINKNSQKKPLILMESEELPERNDSIKRAANKVFCSKLENAVAGGYIDVEYLRKLTSDLKKCNLSTQDEMEIDELELLTLNFINRQPTPTEREKLNGYLSELIKKIARYQTAQDEI